MQRIAAPMVGGMVTAPLLSMVVLPAAYYLLHGRSVRAGAGDSGGATPTARSPVAA
jgi:Cu(I)/Ag(I) efflux system membrane protein CusA/SilA